MLHIAALALLVPSLAASPQYRPVQIQDVGETDVWTRHNLIGQGPRQEHAVVSLDDDIYVLGGVATSDSGELNTINRAEYYQISEELWHVSAPLPQPLNHLNVATVNGKIYLLGALSGGANWTARGESYVYHPGNDSWTEITSMPNGTARASSAVGVLDDVIYLAGGMTYLDLTNNGTQDSVSTVSSYNVSSGAWYTYFPPLPQPRQHVGGAVVKGVFYVVGGREDGISGFADSVHALDLGNPLSWRTMSPMPTARGGLACAAVRYEIFCFGGEGNPDNERGIFEEVEVYDTRADSWIRLTNMPIPRHGTGAVSVGGRIYIPCGGLKEAAHPTGWFDSFKPKYQDERNTGKF
ncbi:hypothetical protein LTR10_001374 [Elasticomyces elasticus]|nr:hypothetical protein LTR10_001374 [Elasticomyces elasticus]KAK4974875.1 hypothetical protein LTR42_004084 [Elasticomyces elasticus]